MLEASPVFEYAVDVEAVFETMTDHVELELIDLSISYPVIADPPLFEGAVQLRLICDDEIAVAVRPVGDPGAVDDDVVFDACSSIAASSQRSPLPLAVQLQATEFGDALIVELDAPVIALGMLTSHSFVQVELPSVTPPYIDGKSRIQLFGYCVVIDIVGLLEAVLWFVTLVGIGFV